MSAISTLPPAPQRNQDAATFSALADAFVASLATFVSECNVLATDLTAKAAAASVSAAAALTSETNAGASAQAAASAGNAASWVSGTNYTLGTCVWSPIDYKTYRCKVAGVSVTDPSLDGTTWTEPLTTMGQNGTTSTDNITLVYNSSGNQSVTPSGYGYFATLPVASTCRKGAALFAITNTGNYDYGIRNASGTKLGWIKPGKTCLVGLADNSGGNATIGAWTISNVDKLGVTAQYSNSTAASSGTAIFQTIVLDSDRTMFVFGGTSIYAIVFNKTTSAWGNPTLIRATVVDAVAVKSTTDQALVISCNSTTGVEAVTLTTSGTTVTVNSAGKASATLLGNLTSFSHVIAVSTSFVVAYGRASGVTAIRALSISGTTVTLGAESILTPGTTVPATLVASSSIVITISTSASVIYAKPFTVAGSTLTAGTEASTTASGNSGYKILTLASGRWALLYVSTNVLLGSILSLAGTVASLSTVSMGSNTSTALTCIEAIAVSTNKLVAFYNNASTSWYANTLTDTAGVASTGTELTGVVVGNIASIAYITTASNVVTFALATTSARAVLNIDVTTTSPSLTSAYVFPNASAMPAFSPTDNFGVRSGKFVIAGSSLYTITADATMAYNVKHNSVGMSYTPPIGQMNLSSSQRQVAGGSDSESWLFSPFTAAVGATFTKVEAAA